MITIHEFFMSFLRRRPAVSGVDGLPLVAAVSDGETLGDLSGKR